MDPYRTSSEKSIHSTGDFEFAHQTHTFQISKLEINSHGIEVHMSSWVTKENGMLSYTDGSIWIYAPLEDAAKLQGLLQEKKKVKISITPIE